MANSPQDTLEGRINFSVKHFNIDKREGTFFESRLFAHIFEKGGKQVSLEPLSVAKNEHEELRMFNTPFGVLLVSSDGCQMNNPETRNVKLIHIRIFAQEQRQISKWDSSINELYKETHKEFSKLR